MGRELNTTAPPLVSNAPALTVRQLRKVYGGTVALADIELDVQPGEIHGLLGENGAGKSTLVRLMAGVEAADGGSLSYFGDELPSRFAAISSASSLATF